METTSTRVNTLTYDEYKVLYDIHKRLSIILNESYHNGYSANRKLVSHAFSCVSNALDACRLAEDLVQ